MKRKAGSFLFLDGGCLGQGHPYPFLHQIAERNAIQSRSRFGLPEQVIG